jgi:hypothetical protein
MNKRIIIALCVGVLLLIAGIYAAITYRRTDEARVTRLMWLRAINIERWQTVQESGWDVPAGGRETRSYPDIHHYERYASGSHQSCSTFGSGSKRTTSCSTVLDYSSRPVWQTRYDYDIERWVVVRTPTRTGENSEPDWPDVSDVRTSATLAIGDERAGQRISRYSVEVQASGQVYTLDFAKGRWRSFRQGKHYMLVLSLFGQPLDLV